MTPLIPQTLNLNGSSGEELLQQYVEIEAALQKAQEAISHAMPHGRDYQTAIDPHAAQDARVAFHERMLAISEMRVEFSEAAMKVAEQHWERQKRRPT